MSVQKEEKMNASKTLSVITAIGVLVLALTTFGLSWKVVLIGLSVSTVCGFIYYKLLKKMVLGV